MYNKEIIERRLHAARKSGLKFVRLPRERSIEIANKLQLLRYGVDNRVLPDQQLLRPLDDKEQAFITSERIICKVDFEYWFTRYYNLELDPGVVKGSGVYDAAQSTQVKIGPPVLLPSQRQFIDHIGRRELECHEEVKKYNFTLGIMALFHKVRQVAATATMRGIDAHRRLWWPGTRSFVASIDDPRVTELYNRDITALDNLVFWQQPTINARVKDTEISFAAPINSRCVYQQQNQKAGGLGVGTQQDIAHLTEVSLWENVGYIKFSLMPAIPKAITSLLVLESTSNGKGNFWHEISEDVRHKRGGFEHWVYSFVPWWKNVTKYRDATVPVNWIPKEHTIKHSEMIERTSPEFNDGVTYRPTRDQLYWWERERLGHLRHGELASFLTNYPATPEQSFQSPNNGALPPEFIEAVEADVRYPDGCYEFDMAGQEVG